MASFSSTMVTLSDIGTTTLANACGSTSECACGAIAHAAAPPPIRGTARARGGRAWGGREPGEFGFLRWPRHAEPVNFSDDGVPGQPITEQARDLAGALAVDPMLLELLNSFFRPRPYLLRR